MKNVQFGMQEDLLVSDIEGLRLSMCNKLGKIVKNKELIEYMVSASLEKMNGERYLVFGFNQGSEQGGSLDILGHYKDMPDPDDINKDIVQVYDLLARKTLCV